MSTSYEIGPFRLDLAAQTLFRGDQTVSLGHRATALLVALVARAGTPVAKDVLIEAAWPGMAVEESNLTVQIAALRRIFAQEPDGERWIETLPRRGYRFIGPVVTQDTDANHVSGASDKPNSPLQLPDKPSIAVLPFQNISNDPDQDYFVDGIVEDIIAGLSRVKWFFVIARNSSFAYKGRATDLKQVESWSRKIGPLGKVDRISEGAIPIWARERDIRLNSRRVSPSRRSAAS